VDLAAVYDPSRLRAAARVRFPGHPVGTLLQIRPGAFWDFVYRGPAGELGEVSLSEIELPTNTSFPLTLTGRPSNLNKSFSLLNGQSDETSNVLVGSGHVAAETVPANWELISVVGDDRSPVTNIDVSPDEVVTCTFTNRLHVVAIELTMTRTHAADGPGDHPHAGMTFTVNGVTKQTDANGKAYFDGLLFGTYTVHETVPAGYHVDANDKSVTVDNNQAAPMSPTSVRR
jgi:hypothetical protein